MQNNVIKQETTIPKEIILPHKHLLLHFHVSPPSSHPKSYISAIKHKKIFAQVKQTAKPNTQRDITYPFVRLEKSATTVSELLKDIIIELAPHTHAYTITDTRHTLQPSWT